MSDFEVRVIDLMEKCQNSLYVVVAIVILSFILVCGVCLIWSIYKDKEVADKNRKQMKKEIIEEIENGRK